MVIALAPLLAVLAGVLSFTSPCTLPLLPGYLGYMSGVKSGRGRAAAAAVMFVLGFTLVFTALGAAASALGSAVFAHKLLLSRLAGVVIILLGLFVAGLARPRWLEAEARPLLGRVRPGPRGAFLLGLAFAFGWTPCVGPMLGAILALAASRTTLATGVGLLLLYSLGLGLPFVAAALFLDRVRWATSWLAQRGSVLNLVGGGLLVLMGLLVLGDQLNAVLAPATQLYARWHWPPL